MLSKTERQRLITEKIISSVYTNNLKNGDRMPSENQLANALNVSRVSVREVYSALELIGIVESRRGEGTFLRTNADSDNMIFRMMLLALYNDNTDVYEIMEIRKIIETSTAERAAMFSTTEDIRRMKRIVKEMKDCTEGTRLSELDNELHSVIAGASGNALLGRLSGIISSLVVSSIKEHWNYIVFDSKPDTRRKTFEQHNELVNAIVRRDSAEAKRIMQEHLGFVSSSLDRYKHEFAEYEDKIKQRVRIKTLTQG